MSGLRECRLRACQSQAQFALKLGVSIETYRVWDSGRRKTPDAVLLRAREVLGLLVPDADELLSLDDLSQRLGVHVRTLRNAAGEGRLRVVLDNKTTFRQLRQFATVAEGLRFRAHEFRRRGCPGDTHAKRPEWGIIPPDYERQIRDLRARMGLSQADLAEQIGASGKAVVYQWESRKRMPNPVFWHRIEALMEFPVGS